MRRFSMVLSVLLLTASMAWAAEQKEDKKKDPPKVSLHGEVVDAIGQPVADAKVTCLTYLPNGKSEATTDADGKFTLNVYEGQLQYLPLLVDDSAGDRMGVHKPEYKNPPKPGDSVKISLEPSRTVTLQVTDASGKPSPETKVGGMAMNFIAYDATTNEQGETTLRWPISYPPDRLFAFKEDIGFDYRVVSTRRDAAHVAPWFDEPIITLQLAPSQTIRLRLIDRDGQPIPGIQAYNWLLRKPGEPDSFNLGMTQEFYRSTSNKDGVVSFPGTPTWNEHPFILWPSSPDHIHLRITYDTEQHADGPMEVVLDKYETISGQVVDVGGKPVAGIKVVGYGSGGTTDRLSGSCQTDDEGKLEMKVPPNAVYALVATDDKKRLASKVVSDIVVKPKASVQDVTITVGPATRVYGKVVSNEDATPIPDASVQIYASDLKAPDLEALGIPTSEESRWSSPPPLRWYARTSEDGTYEVFVGPGGYNVESTGTPSRHRFTVTDQKELEFNFVKEIPRSGSIQGNVVNSETGDPVADVVVDGVYRNERHVADFRARTDDDGQFNVQRQLYPITMYVASKDGSLKGIVEVTADQKSVTIPISPVASVKGRMIDRDTKEPKGNTEIGWGRRIYLGYESSLSRTSWGGKVTTDADGNFTATGLVVGQEYHFTVEQVKHRYSRLTDFTPETPGLTDLGDLSLAPPYKPPTFEERVDRLFANKKTLEVRMAEAKVKAEQRRQNILVLFVDRKVPLAKQVFELRLDNHEAMLQLFNYQHLFVDLDTEGAGVLASTLGISLDEAELPSVWIGDPSGSRIHSTSLPRTEKGDEINVAATIELMKEYTPEPLDGRDLLREALAEAKASNRRVIVQETATWCGPCHMLADYLEKHRETWEKDYILLKMDDRWTGANEIMDNIEDPKNRGGVPWVAILDSDGKMLTNSNSSDGNIGFPSSEKGIAHFMTMLNDSKIRLTKEDLQTLKIGLKKK
ncbi:thioredoxin family protein [Bremerella alba]|uniref:Nickel uptake substrate-specific transmembrane region n=1 Tax=Bremerella alba TaxID=980252 RepID=A0A7V8V5J7_9BACT|nr:thioredoxin family protein [Bremerella alba]MBA2115353.1 hypothetical protein [Bremerella alba]